MQRLLRVSMVLITFAMAVPHALSQDAQVSIPFNPNGASAVAYVPGQMYQQGQLVNYQNTTYMSLVYSNTATPSAMSASWWEMGGVGATGPQGPPGTPGNASCLPSGGTAYTCSAISYNNNASGEARAINDNYGSIFQQTQITDRTSGIDETYLAQVYELGLADWQYRDDEIADRDGLIEGAMEGHHAIGRTEIHEALPFAAKVYGIGGSGYNLAFAQPIQNQGNLSAGLDVIDVTQGVSATISSMSGQTATLAAAHGLGISTQGTVNAGLAIPAGTLYETGYTPSSGLAITYAGGNPTGLVCALWGVNTQVDFVMVASATAISGGWSIVAPFRANHNAGDNIACGGGVHYSIRQDNMVQTAQGQTVWYDDDVLATPTATTLIIGHTILGNSSYTGPTNAEFMGTGAVTIYPAARIVNATDPSQGGIYSGTDVTLDHPISWAVGDAVMQPNYIAAAYVEQQGQIERDNPYLLYTGSHWNKEQFNLTGAGIANSAVHEYSTNEPGVMWDYRTGTGWSAALVEQQEPTPTPSFIPVLPYVRCITCITQPTGAAYWVIVDASATGIDGIQINPATNTTTLQDNVVITGTTTAPALKSNSGTRFVCVDSNGKFSSSTSPCSGT